MKRKKKVCQIWSSIFMNRKISIKSAFSDYIDSKIHILMLVSSTLYPWIVLSFNFEGNFKANILCIFDNFWNMNIWLVFINL